MQRLEFFGHGPQVAVGFANVAAFRRHIAIVEAVVFDAEFGDEITRAVLPAPLDNVSVVPTAQSRALESSYLNCSRARQVDRIGIEE